MNSIKRAVSAKGEGDVIFDPDALTQAVRINGMIQHIPVGEAPYRLGRTADTDDADLTAGVTDEDLSDMPSGVGMEMQRAGVGTNAILQDEVALAARSGGVHRRVAHEGGAIHLSQALDAVENRCASFLMEGWEDDKDFAAAIADMVVDEFGFRRDDVLAAIKGRR